MSALHRFRAPVFVILLGTVVLVSHNLDGAPPDKEQIAKLVKQLGDNDFDVREAASRKLLEVGEPAEDALATAAKSDDAEVSRRATEILERFKWGLYPDTPKNVAELIEAYKAAEAGARGKSSATSSRRACRAARPSSRSPGPSRTPACAPT